MEKKLKIKNYYPLILYVFTLGCVGKFHLCGGGGGGGRSHRDALVIESNVRYPT